MIRAGKGLLLTLALAASASSAQAQILKRVKDRARAELEKAVRCAVTDQQCIAKAKEEGKPIVLTDEAGNPVPEDQQQPAASSQEKPGEGAWANYDFVPGERILFQEDFSTDVVGDFPRRMEFKSGALEIIEWKNTRWLRATEDSKFYIILPETLPSRFTMEFDFAIPAGAVWIYFGPSSSRLVVFSGNGSVGVRNADAEIEANGQYERNGDPNRIRRGRVLADGKYVKVYVDDKRILNVPNGDMERDARILFWTDAAVDQPTLFTNFVVAAGGRRLYDAIVADGRVATQGIFFDTGSDGLRPESTPTLKEIGAMLKEHLDLCVLIEGHTDNVGDDASNLALSQKRADAVKRFLVESFGVEDSRLESAGFGETRPASDNDTAEGRQNNRRVELVKLARSP